MRTAAVGRRRQHLDRHHAGPEPSRRRQPAVVRRLADARAPRRSLRGDVGGDRRVRRPLSRSAGLIKERIPDVQASRVNGLTTTADALWLCTASRGVLSWNGSTLVSYRQPGESGGQCSSILADRQDRVWAGFSSGGVALHEHGTVRALTERDGLAPGLVWQIVQGNDDDVVVRHLGRREPLSARPLHVRHYGACARHGRRPDAGRGCAGLRLGRGALGRRADALPCGRDGQDRERAEPSSRLHALRRERWTAARHADVAERRRGRARHGRADLGRQRPRHDDHRPAATARSAPGVAAEPRSRHRQRRARQPGGRRGAFANGSTVQIEYAALSLSATSKLRFRHLLDGVDADWVYDADGRRASYANLRAGDYRFRVSTTEGGAVDRAVAVGVHGRSAVLSEPLVSHRRQHRAGRRDRRRPRGCAYGPSRRATRW